MKDEDMKHKVQKLLFNSMLTEQSVNSLTMGSPPPIPQEVTENSPVPQEELNLQFSRLK